MSQQLFQVYVRERSLPEQAALMFDDLTERKKHGFPLKVQADWCYDWKWQLQSWFNQLPHAPRGYYSSRR